MTLNIIQDACFTKDSHKNVKFHYIIINYDKEDILNYNES